ncbi:MAG: hypothetical protein ACOYMV_10675 [Verrucomicrobiia bacterium]
MSFLQIPPEKRIQLPWCPDYTRLFEKAEREHHYRFSRLFRELRFKAKRAAKLRRKANRRLPKGLREVLAEALRLEDERRLRRQAAADSASSDANR